ncbi:hypothetical protein Rsub_07358 [Raphidocelis subcapitata]|uniref:BACK domain-containing protein n=1 Tax=Raphidocelis subcapitata TaxID=307507 RepID=A0A2V0P899_9CHLO|nr:hypothetical protein Rsub_07358 [Raphidocelis subcapitata]|eukprot:GBF94090.1 hypothetical protein Rsub_07358 [Raphidocelis subcapitata]
MAVVVAGDLSRWFGSTEFADVTVRFVLEGTGAPPTADADAGSEQGPGEERPLQRRRLCGSPALRELPAHRIVLAQGSTWARAALGKAWKTKDGALDILLGSEGELEAAELVLRMIYHAAREPGKLLSGVAQATMLQVMALADQLGATGPEAAAAAALAAAPALEWQSILALASLPPVRTRSPTLAPLMARVADAVLARFDSCLDSIWRNKDRAATLRALPFGALRALLTDPRTAASSEEMAFYTAAAWLSANGARASERDEAALVECIRLPGLHSLYSATAAQSSEWVTRHVTAAKLHATAAAGAAPRELRAGLLAAARCPRGCQLLARPPAPAGEGAAEIVWELTGEQVAAMGEGRGVPPPPLGQMPLVSGGLVWRGHLRFGAKSGFGPSAVDAVISARGPPGAASFAACVKLTAECSPLSARPPVTSAYSAYVSSFGMGPQQPYETAAQSFGLTSSKPEAVLCSVLGRVAGATETPYMPGGQLVGRPGGYPTSATGPVRITVRIQFLA